MIKLSAKEMHIYVTQGLQREGSHRKDKQLFQAIDLGLNLAQGELIKYRVKPTPDIPYKFEVNQEYVSDIQPLIKLNCELDVYTIGTKSYAALPYDFAYLLSDQASIIADCQTGFKTATTASQEKIITIPFNSAKSAAPYYTDITVSVGSNTRTINTIGFSSTLEKVYLVDYIIDAFADLGVSAYWELYKGKFTPNAFILTTRDLTLTAGLIVDTTPATVDTTTKAITVFNTTLVGDLTTTRDTKADFFDLAATASKYHKSIPTSPLAVVAGDQLIVQGSERFLASKIFVSYIRKPKRINLALNQGSELHPITHQDICDLAVKILKKQVEDNTFQQEAQDTNSRIRN